MSKDKFHNPTVTAEPHPGSAHAGIPLIEMIWEGRGMMAFKQLNAEELEALILSLEKAMAVAKQLATGRR